MNEYIIGLAWAFWAGILTSVSPCPLATNIAAISFLSRKISRTGSTVISGISYALGRMGAYLVVGMVVTEGILAIPLVSFFLQKYINIVLGIVVGMFLLELIQISFGSGRFMERIQRQMVTGKGTLNIIWSILLGFIFALAFCPVSAALFFGIPISLKINSPVFSPLLYGFGTAIPVLEVVVVFTLSGKTIGSFFIRISAIEKWVRLVTGVVIVLIGLYLSVTQIL